MEMNILRIMRTHSHKKHTVSISICHSAETQRATHREREREQKDREIERLEVKQIKDCENKNSASKCVSNFV